jgi:hypothetical protein
MKLGTENRNKLIAAGVLGVLAAVLVARAFWNPSGAESTPTPAASTSAITPLTAPAAKKTVSHLKTRGKKATGGSEAPRSLNPELRFDWLSASENTKYEGSGRNIFSVQAPPPTPVAPANTDSAQEKANAGPPPPPPPPPINLKFFGFASKPGEQKRVFLSQGEDVFIAREGETVDRRYKIVKISPMSVEIEDEIYNNRQSIPLTQG